MPPARVTLYDSFWVVPCSLAWISFAQKKIQRLVQIVKPRPELSFNPDLFSPFPPLNLLESCSYLPIFRRINSGNEIGQKSPASCA